MHSTTAFGMLLEYSESSLSDPPDDDESIASKKGALLPGKIESTESDLLRT
jgi:hypothetical protein